MADTARPDPVQFSQRWRVRRRAADGVLLAEVTSEWVYVGVADGRPTRVPAELVKAFSPVVGE